MRSEQNLSNKARKKFLDGNTLLSKRAEMFLPGQWQAYLSKAKGCKVWDLDVLEYDGMSIMGIEANTLGYGNEEVDKAVRGRISLAGMSTFDCPADAALSEKLHELHSLADMVQSTRSDGEANVVTIRIHAQHSEEMAKQLVDNAVGTIGIWWRPENNHMMGIS